MWSLQVEKSSSQLLNFESSLLEFLPKDSYFGLWILKVSIDPMQHSFNEEYIPQNKLWVYENMLHRDHLGAFALAEGGVYFTYPDEGGINLLSMSPD